MVPVSNIKALKFRRPGSSLQVRGLQVSELSFVPRTPPSVTGRRCILQRTATFWPCYPIFPLQSCTPSLPFIHSPLHTRVLRTNTVVCPGPLAVTGQEEVPEPRRSGRAGRMPLIPQQPPSGPGTWPQGTGLTRWEGDFLQIPRTCTPLPTVTFSHLPDRGPAVLRPEAG